VQDLAPVQEAVEASLGFGGVDLPPKPEIPETSWAPHSTPRCQVFVDRETQSPVVSLMFKKPRSTIATPEECLAKMTVRCTPSMSVPTKGAPQAALLHTASIPVHPNHASPPACCTIISVRECHDQASVMLQALSYQLSTKALTRPSVLHEALLTPPRAVRRRICCI
jgi:hypothetical protein